MKATNTDQDVTDDMGKAKKPGRVAFDFRFAPPTPTAAPILRLVSVSHANMAPSSLPAAHPLILELSSLRTQLAQYQHSSHTAGIQLQGSKLELSLIRDQNASLASTFAVLQAELEVLRAHPEPPLLKPDSTALSELSLAHRRLSAKLDITEESFSASKLELAAARQEIGRLGKERERDRAQINEFRRVEEEREEELVWERGERRKAEEQKKLW